MENIPNSPGWIPPNAFRVHGGSLYPRRLAHLRRLALRLRLRLAFRRGLQTILHRRLARLRVAPLRNFFQHRFAARENAFRAAFGVWNLVPFRAEMRHFLYPRLPLAARCRLRTISVHPGYLNAIALVASASAASASSASAARLSASSSVCLASAWHLRELLTAILCRAPECLACCLWRVELDALHHSDDTFLVSPLSTNALVGTLVCSSASNHCLFTG